MDHSQHLSQSVTQASADISSLFMPHGHCYLWQPALVWINASTDTLIFLSYLMISFLLTLTVIRVKEIPFQKIYLAFGLFIVACGFGHLMDLIDIWTPVYWATAWVKVITATASVGTAVALPFYLPKIRELAQGALLIQAQKELKESERKYLHLVETTTECVIRANLGGQLEYTNSQFETILGFTADELKNQLIWDFIDTDDRRNIESQIANLKDHQQLQEIKFRRKDRKPVWFLAIISKTKNDRGETTGLLGVLTDVTARRAIEEKKNQLLTEIAEEMERSKQFLDSVIDNLPNTLFIKDATHLRYLKLNKAGEDVLEINREKVLGKSDHDLMPKAMADENSAREREVLKAGGVFDFEEQVTTTTGELRYMRTKKVALHSPDGESKYLLGISVDVTDQKLNEQELIAAREQAIAATKVKSEFLANMSHEIRTPLNGIIGITDLLIDSGLSASQEEYAKIVKRSGDSLLHIINDILDFSKIEAGKLDITSTDFSLDQLLKSSLEVFHFRLLERNVELVSELDPQLPKFIHGDSVRIGQVLLNLVGNAVKFTENGKVSVNIKQEEIQGEYVCIRVSIKDSGIGISDEEQARLFNPFVQADGTMARTYGGTGLGLSICKRLVNMMGGEIGVISKKGEGSTFWFTLLVQEAQQFTDVVPSLAEVVSRAQQDFNPNALKILVAEDNSTNQILTLALLKRAGYEAVAVPNGRAVVEEFTKNRYDLILMDCQMPEMDGYEATRRIREIEKESNHAVSIPILALTANAMKSDEEKCRENGMDDFLTKPIKREALSQALERWLKKAA